MKYLKRFFLLFFALVLLTTGLSLPASAANVGDTLYLNSSNATFTIDVSNCNTWQDIPSDQKDCTLTWDTSGYMFCQPKTSVTKYIIIDDSGNPVSYNMEFTSSVYELCYVLEFDITETDAVGNRLVTYYFKENWAGDRSIGYLARMRTPFYNETLGLCHFVYEGDGKYVFGISKRSDGSFAERWYLVSSFANGKPVLQTDYSYTLTNGHYYGVDPCALGDHLLGEFNTVRAATCAREGAEVAYCKYCQASVEKSISCIDHNYSWGKCTGCGDLLIIPGNQGDPDYDLSVSETNPPSSPDNAPTDPSDTPSEEDASEPGFWDLLKNWAKDAADGLKAGLDKLISSITGGGADGSGGGSADGGAGGGDGNEPGTDSGGGFFAGIGKLFKNAGDAIAKWLGLDKVSGTVSSLIKTVVIITFCCVLIGLIPVLTPFFKWVWKGVVFTWNSLKDLFKSIGNSVSKSSRSRKTKNKKRTKK